MTEIPGRANGGPEQLAQRFQRAWKDGGRPRIEDYLKGVDQPLRAKVFERLLKVEWDVRRENGEESSVEEYVARFPNDGAVIESVLGPTLPPPSSGPQPSAHPGQSRDSTNSGLAAGALPPELADHDEYENVRVLGDGGIGVVYLAHNRLMGRDEVLKIMARHIVERPGAMERFAREIRAVAKLRHPNIVSAYSAFRSCGSLVFAMEYVEGLDLRKMVKARGPLPVAQSCNYIYQSALSLQHAHEEGMVHRDIKPGNLMLSHRKGRAVIKLLDFGLAKATTEENAIELRAAEASYDGDVEAYATRAGQMLGTPDFIAPEQIFDATQADIRADIYSLGCTLYYLLTARPPFDGSSLREVLHAHTSKEPASLCAVRPDVPKALAQVAARMLAKDPSDRYQQPAEVAAALKPLFKQTDSGFKAVDVGTEAPFHAVTARLAAAEPVADQRADSDEPDFEVLTPATPTAAVGATKSGANRRQAVAVQPAARPAGSASQSHSAGTAVGTAPTLVSRLQSPTVVIALAATALGAIGIAAVVLLLARSSPQNGETAQPAGAVAAAKSNRSVPSATRGNLAAANPQAAATPSATVGPEATNSASNGQPAVAPTVTGKASLPQTKGSIAAPVLAETGWIERIGDLTVRVDSARLIGKRVGNSGECLEVTLKISNASKQAITLRRWTDPDIAVELSDQYHNYYGRIGEQVQDTAIPPEKTIFDTLYFEPTNDQVNLVLRLPVPGTNSAFRLGIASRFIQRGPFLTAQPLAGSAVPEKPPASADDADPTKDPQKRKAIISEYWESMADIKHRAMFMSTNDAASFKKREPKNLVKSLAKKHNLTEDQIKLIVEQ
jgi:serine/threonine protein kinase